MSYTKEDFKIDLEYLTSRGIDDKEAVSLLRNVIRSCFVILEEVL